MPDDLNEEHAAAIWDGYAEKFILLNAPIRFATAQSPAEQEAVCRARYAEVVQNGWAAPAEMPDGIERDEYDDDALHLIAWEDDRMVMVGRLVFPSTNRLLPTEAAFDVRITPPLQVVDTGRAILLQSDHHDRQHRIFMGLMCFAWQQMRARGYYRGCGAMTGSMLRLYRLMGIHWEVLGEARLYWGEMRYPCQLDLVRTVQSLTKRGILT